MILVRNIQVARWVEPRDGFASDEVDADLIQGKELRVDPATNDLSFWRFDPSVPSWRDQALLALALSPIFKQKKPVGISIAWLDEDEVRAAGVAIEAVKGDTYVSDLRAHHVSLILLDSQRLSAVARLIAAAVRVRACCHDATIDEVVGLCAQACRDHRVSLSNLPPQWSDEIRARLLGPT